ncbi:hypothetical protein [Actinoplanes sp. NPDC049118]|uniref:hypothetical protein n=1 Tax=Actinoplanes sp. NPDC049118 TaxID=3155769 RepID=UPI0033D5C55A
MTDVALLIEPTKIDKGVPNTYQGETTLRDEVTADVTIFATAESLDRGTPSEVIKGAKVVHGMLTSTLERLIGTPMVAVVRRVPTRRGSGFAFRDVEPSIEAAVAAFYEQREAAVTAALSSGDMPSFD